MLKNKNGFGENVRIHLKKKRNLIMIRLLTISIILLNGCVNNLINCKEYVQENTKDCQIAAVVTIESGTTKDPHFAITASCPYSKLNKMVALINKSDKENFEDVKKNFKYSGVDCVSNNDTQYGIFLVEKALAEKPSF
jgi:hypothetical protein